MKKNIVITGVTSGLGESLTQKFVSLGWNVIGISRDEIKLTTMNKKYNNKFKGIACDIKDSTKLKEVFDKITENNLHIDLLINNAAIFKSEKFDKSSIYDIDSIIDINLKGVMYTTLFALRKMKKFSKERSSRIINIASVAAINGIENQSIYCASKFGLNGFAEALNQESIKDNISITTLFPGGINTPLWNEKNPYMGGDKEDILETSDIVELVTYISKLHPRIILKNMTLFPSNEWH